MVATERTVVPADSAAATVVIGVGREGAKVGAGVEYAVVEREAETVEARVEYAVVEREAETVEARVATMVAAGTVEEMEGAIASSIQHPPLELHISDSQIPN